jgi:hypothetical protein
LELLGLFKSTTPGTLLKAHPAGLLTCYFELTRDYQGLDKSTRGGIQGICQKSQSVCVYKTHRLRQMPYVLQMETDLNEEIQQLKDCGNSREKGYKMVTIDIKAKHKQQVRRGGEISYPFTKRLYTFKEAAFYLGKGLYGVRELVWSGNLPIVRQRRKMFIDIIDLESHVTKNRSTYI